MVGGISALVGAIILGPRIGKYGKNGKVNAIPGHSITLGALGVFILWFAWYGFNGAAAEDGARLGQILLTTTIAPAVATVTTMLFTWIKNGKPDVSMCLNASLAGLVAITAGCADVDAIGAAVIGIVSGILIVVAVEFVDIKLKKDDPVGAFSVHGVNGMWGGLAVGLFATGNGQNGVTGLFYGGGFAQLGKQALGIVTIVAWTVVCMIIVFTIIKKTVGLRVTKDRILLRDSATVSPAFPNPSIVLPQSLLPQQLPQQHFLQEIRNGLRRNPCRLSAYFPSYHPYRQ